MLKPSVNTIIGVIAVVASLSILGTLQWGASNGTISAGFWYEDFPFTLPEEQTVRLGGPLTATEVESIKRISHIELERAVSGLRIVISDRQDAFWRIRVVQDLGRLRLPRSGEAYGLGPLGGAGSVSFLVAALGALHYAPPGASRQEIVQGVGRGVGRAAAHELGHAILGAMLVHNNDKNSYEFGSWDRTAQYYGELHWTTAWPLLQEKIGR